jgi:hypothetical protein
MHCEQPPFVPLAIQLGEKHESILFPKTFQSKISAFSALCEPTQPRNARVVYLRYLVIP